MAARVDPVRTYNFLIALMDSGSSMSVAPADLTASPQGGFSECTGLETTLEVEDYREGGNNAGVLKFPSRNTWMNLHLRRGVTTSALLWKWYYEFVQGKGKRRDGLIILQNDERQPIKVWHFIRGIPVKYAAPSMNANTTQVAIEELEIAHEGLKLMPTSLSMTIEELGSAIGEIFS